MKSNMRGQDWIYACQMPRNARVIATTAETVTESIIIKNTGLMDKEELTFFSKGSCSIDIFKRRKRRKRKVQEQ